MKTPRKYGVFLCVLLTAFGSSAQESAIDSGDSEKEKKFVTVGGSNPDAVVLNGPDWLADPLKVLKINEELEVLDEKDGDYVKVRVKIDGEWKEGWVKEKILNDQPLKAESGMSQSEGAEVLPAAAKGSVGMEPVDGQDLKLDAQQNPWEYIDPTAPNAKIVSSPLPYHLIIPGALIVGGGALAAILAATSDNPDPVEPEENPQPEDPEFSLVNDEYTIPCGQELNMFPLDNDAGTGLTVLEINNPPEGIQLLNDSTIFASSTLNSDVSFTIDIEDAVGQVGTTTVTVVVEEIEVQAVGESFEMIAGEVVTGNVLQNDLCFGCIVTGTSGGGGGTLVIQENGDFEFSADDDFTLEIVYTVSIENPCGAQSSSDLVFIVNPEPPCTFEWGGNVQVVPANCGLSNGAALATEELFGPYNFSWSNGVNFPENEDIPSGSYQLIVTDTTFGCTDTLFAEVEELPADYGAEATVIEGGCGETDNIQLNTNAGVDNPLMASLSGSTSGMIENITESAILLGDVIELNSGNLTITIWSEQQGEACSQALDIMIGEGPPIPELVVTDVVQPQPPENVGTIVLDLINAALPADIIVNGEVYTTAMAPQVILDGLPPGTYLISVVDFEGCESAPVEVFLEMQGMHPHSEFLRWSPQTAGLTNWVNTPANLLMETKEGQDYFTPVSTPFAVPISIEFLNDNWAISGAYTSLAFQQIGNGRRFVEQGQYFEVAVGKKIEALRGNFCLKFGYAEWHLPRVLVVRNVRTAYIDGAFTCPVKHLSGQLHFGVRTGLIIAAKQWAILPKVQWTFGL